VISRTFNMYSEYGAVGGIDCQMLAGLHQLQRMQQATSMTSDWLRVLPTSRSLLTSDWRSSMRELQKWRPTPVVTETTRCQPLNLDNVGDETVSSSLCRSSRRRRHSDVDGERPTEEQRPANRPATVATRRRFDFTRLAESATRCDDSSPTASHAEITSSNGDNGGVKVVNDNCDQSDRRLSLKPAAAVEDADKQSLISSLPHRSTPQPPKSVFHPIESFVRYTCTYCRRRLMIR